MATRLLQIEKNIFYQNSKISGWLKKQMNRYLRRKNKKIDEDDVGCKRNTKPYCGWG